MDSEERKQRKRESNKRWREAHPEKVRENNKQYYSMHRDDEEWMLRKREKDKCWREAHPEKVKENFQRYYINHREQKLLYSKAYYRNIRDKAMKYDEITGGGSEVKDGREQKDTIPD